MSAALENKGPVLHKLLEAFDHACSVYQVGTGLKALPESSRLIQGE
jgi:hypothetical protein